MGPLIHPFTATCAETGRRLPALADGELGHFTRRRVERHLAICPGCRRMFERLLRGIDALRAARNEPAPAPPSVADAVLDRIRAEDPLRHEGDP